MAWDFGYGFDQEDPRLKLIRQMDPGMFPGILSAGQPAQTPGTGLLTALPEDAADRGSYASLGGQGAPLPPGRPIDITPRAPTPPPIQRSDAGNVVGPPQAMASGPVTQPATSSADPLSSIMGGLGRNSDALLSFGAGLMSGRNWGEGLSKGVAGMQEADKNSAATALARMKLGQQVAGQNATLAYLMSKGFSKEAAVAGASNPHLLTTMLADQNKAPISVSPGTRLVDPKDPSKVLYEAPKEQAPISVGAGSTLVDPVTRQPIFTAEKPEEPYTLGPGQERRVGDRLIAAVPAADKLTDQAAQREGIAKNLGLKPETEAYKSYIATGKLPGEDQKITPTDKTAILEADEAVQSTRRTIGQLQKAKELSPKAYSGFGAGSRGYLTSQFGSEAGTATEELHSTVVGGALESLKATFGAAPTEGERKILLEVQGSVNQAPQVREKIFQRAIEAAEARMKFNEERAAALRGGNYYKPQGGAAASPSTASAPAADPLASARAAIAQGASRSAVIQRLQQNGIDPKGL